MGFAMPNVCSPPLPPPDGRASNDSHEIISDRKRPGLQAHCKEGAQAQRAVRAYVGGTEADGLAAMAYAVAATIHGCKARIAQLLQVRSG